MPESKDLRRYAPATERNRVPICSVLETVLPPQGTILEIASGTGQHAVFLAPRLRPRHWLPSDPNPAARASIRGWLETAPAENLHPPLALDMTQPDWFQWVVAWQAAEGKLAPPIAAIAAINMIHIAPWLACAGLMAGAETLLAKGSVLYLYGPFKQQGQHTAPSNEAFDQSLRLQNPDWGVRDLEAVTQLANAHQFQLSDTIAMPANNLSVVFTRQ
ncbi:MAG: DUF938 domain-containing protein [Leptolyngbya sp. SIO1E4]|nr:DUF938 domain-containing protein [Leptolyngbya sp. SIO1E4]